MADKVQQELRTDASEDGAVTDRRGVASGDPRAGGSGVTPGEGGDDTETPAKGRDAAVVIESDDERKDREGREWLADVDATEIVDGGESTVAYRRAVAIFDPDTDEIQLAEHWEFVDAEFERNGRM